MRTRKAKDRSRLIQAAMGQIPCDLTIGNVQFFNAITGEIYPASVDILDGFVVLVREEGQEAVLPSKSYYDGHGRYLIPGYIDTHMHIESTMMIPENLARAILPWGTTTICTDPHEIGNVMGLDGVRFMLENAKKSKLRQYVLAPSCVPSLPGMENAGAEFLAREVGELLDMDDVIGIAEIMDYVGVIHDSERMHTIIDEGLRRGMFLQGHAPYCFGRELAAYRIGGPVSDHESVNADEVRAKLRAGMHINLRASSLIDNLSFLVDGCKDQPWRDFVSICTDDVHAKDLLTVGHINNVVRKAVASGLDGREVVKMATFNAAREYGFDDLGAIAPGYIADIQLVDALDGSRPKAVFTEGVLVAEDGKYLGGDCKTADYDLPNTVDLPQITGPESFELRVPEGYTGDTIRVNVMVSEDGNRILPPEPTVNSDGSVTSANYGELREDKFYVLTASTAFEETYFLANITLNSWNDTSMTATMNESATYDYFVRGLCLAGGYNPATHGTSWSGRAVTLQQAYSSTASYVKTHESSSAATGHKYSTVMVYPAASSFVLFQH